MSSRGWCRKRNRHLSDDYPTDGRDRRWQNYGWKIACRGSWLESLGKLVSDCLIRNEDAVLACSALKESYREFLLLDEQVKLVYLKGDYQLIRERLAQRRGHYMDPALLDSQFETLEEPSECLRVDASSDPHAIIRTIRDGLSI